MKILLNYHYPGNVRELENVLEHALIICSDDMIQTKHLPDYVHSRPSAITASAPVLPRPDHRDAYAEREKIKHLLEINNGNRTRTATALGVDRTTLWRKMKRYGIHG
jgi:transcriptional regulator with PAS, ATPase and Fis domain